MAEYYGGNVTPEFLLEAELLVAESLSKYDFMVRSVKFQFHSSYSI
jgi:hypothetical protein